jgi:ATP-dependent exoDNAse (exonuclease V) beta subunit
MKGRDAVKPPLYLYLSAKAGSGKTETLASVYLAILLHRIASRMGSDLPPSFLGEIVALTFTNEAAFDMRRRILQLLVEGAKRNLSEGRKRNIQDWMKELYGDAPEDLQFSQLCALALETIYLHYSRFSVMTLDRFIIRLFMAGLVEMGIAEKPEVGISLDRFAEDLLRFWEGQGEGFRATIQGLFRYLEWERERLEWDPLQRIWRMGVESLIFFASFPPRMRFLDQELPLGTDEDLSKKIGAFGETSEKLEEEEKEILGELSLRSGKALKHAGIFQEKFRELLEKIADKDNRPRSLSSLVEGRKLTQRIFRKGEGDPSFEEEWREVLKRAEEFLFRKKPFLKFTFYQILKLLVEEGLMEILRREGRVPLPFVQTRLALKLEEDGGIPPLFYYRMGGRIRAILLDEFQDTSPLQWYLLRPIAHELLSGGEERGVLLVVGDPRQSLYSFRGGDWKLMKAIEPENGKIFPSAEERREIFQKNRRSTPTILEYISRVFSEENLRSFCELLEGEEKKGKGISAESLYSTLQKVGLHDVRQESDRVGPSGETLPRRSEVRIYTFFTDAEKGDEGVTNEGDRGEDSLQSVLPPLVERVLKQLLLEEKRKPGEITFLCERNEHVEMITDVILSLNKEDPFKDSPLKVLSFSSLDLRKDPAVSEVVELIRYLSLRSISSHSAQGPLFRFTCGQGFGGFLFLEENLPFLPDDLRGEEGSDPPRRFIRWLERKWIPGRRDRCSREDEKNDSFEAFLQRELSGIWGRSFEPLLSRHRYLGVYELIGEIYRRFSLFRVFSEEEQRVALLGFLEKVRRLERERGADPFEVIRSFEEEGSEGWEVEGVRSEDAIPVMTIHKAKGKESPAVVYLHLPDRLPTYSGVLDRFWVSWEGEGERSHLGDPQKPWFSEVYPILNKKWIENLDLNLSEKLREIRQEKEIREIVDRLTRTYVALTRAKESLYLLLGRKDKNPGKQDLESAFFRLLTLGREEEGIPLKGSEASPSFWEIPLPIRGEDVPSPAIREEESVGRREGDPFSGLFSGSSPRLPVRSGTPEEAVSGIEIHDSLSRIFLRDPHWRKKLEGYLSSILPASEISLILEQIERGFSEGILAPSPPFEEEIEREILDPQGNLYRPDRILIYPERVVLLEFKTGEIEREHFDQVRGYLDLLREIYPGRKVEGYLVPLMRSERWIPIEG